MFQSSNVIQSYIWQDIPDVFLSFASTIQWSNQNKTTVLYKASLQQLITSGKGERRESKMTARFQMWVTLVMRFQKQNGKMTAENSDRFMRSEMMCSVSNILFHAPISFHSTIYSDHIKHEHRCQIWGALDALPNQRFFYEKQFTNATLAKAKQARH